MASAISCLTFFTGNDGCATITKCTSTTCVTGARSLQRIDAIFGIQVFVRGEVAQRRNRPGVTVGRGARRELGADDAGGTGAVLDDHLLAVLRREFRSDHPRDDIDAAARRERHDDAHRL